MKKLTLILGICCTLIGTAHAVDYTEVFNEDFSTFDSTNFELKGLAVHDAQAGNIQLTPASGYVDGAVCYNNQLQNSWFKTTFDFSFGPGSGDGIFLFYTDEPLTVVGDKSESYYTGIADGVMVNFMTWGSDPVNDNTLRVVGLPEGGWWDELYMVDIVPDMTNNGIFTADVEIYNNTLNVWLSNDSIGYAKTLLLSGSIAGNVPTNGYVSLLANTGTYTNTHYVDAWSLSTTPMIPEPSMLLFAGAAALLSRRSKK